MDLYFISLCHGPCVMIIPISTFKRSNRVCLPPGPRLFTDDSLPCCADP